MMFSIILCSNFFLIGLPTGHLTLFFLHFEGRYISFILTKFFSSAHSWYVQLEPAQMRLASS